MIDVTTTALPKNFESLMTRSPPAVPADDTQSRYQPFLPVMSPAVAGENDRIAVEPTVVSTTMLRCFSTLRPLTCAPSSTMPYQVCTALSDGSVDSMYWPEPKNTNSLPKLASPGRRSSPSA